MKTFSKFFILLLVAILFPISTNASESIASDIHMETRVLFLLRSNVQWDLQDFCSLMEPFNDRNCLKTLPILRSVKTRLRSVLRDYYGLKMAENLLPILQDALLSHHISLVHAAKIERLAAILTAFVSDTQPKSGIKRSLPEDPLNTIKTARRRIQDE